MRIKTFCIYNDGYYEYIFDKWEYISKDKIRGYYTCYSNPNYYGLDKYPSKVVQVSRCKFEHRLLPSKFERRLCRAVKQWYMKSCYGGFLWHLRYDRRYQRIAIISLAIVLFSTITFLLTW